MIAHEHAVANNNKFHLKPSCVLAEDECELQLIFNMSPDGSSRLNAYLSQDGKRLNLVGKDSGETEYLWVFDVPSTLQAKAIQVEGHDGLFLVHIPRKRQFYQKNRSKSLAG